MNLRKGPKMALLPSLLGMYELEHLKYFHVIFFFTILQCQMLSAPNINQAPESEYKVFSAPRASQSLHWHYFSAKYVLVHTVWPSWADRL